MTVLREIRVSERIEIDLRRIDALVRDMGTPSAERLVGRAIDEIADRVAILSASFVSGDTEAVARSARHLVPVARAIGLEGIARVAGDVIRTAERGDAAAFGATVLRLMRLADGAIHAIGEAWAANV